MVAKIMAVLTSLEQAGIRARRGTLNERAIAPASPVAVVYPEKSAPEELVVAVELFGANAVECEDMAYEAVAVLNGIRGSCTVEKCKYTGKTGLFSVKILAQWDAALAQRVYLDDTLLPNVISFRADSTCAVYQAEDGTGMQTEWTWNLTLTELLPAGKVPEESWDGSHTIRVVTAGGTEVYSGGYWSSVSRKGDSRGTLQQRTLKCWTRTTA